MQLYNTMARKKEPFIPLREGKVNMYVCGITAYDYSHIGHARSAVVFDVLVRYLRYLGLDVTFIRNFTDVEDKIIKRANEEGISWEEVVDKYIKAFHEDMDELGVLRADIEPKATDHIKDMINLCETLISSGHAYSTPSGDVYFRVRSFPAYGKLSGRKIDDLVSGARVAPGEEKEDPLDFSLWKGAKPGEPAWESPWGPGRPGWHIECSAMSEKYVEMPLDIHGGGLDLIFPHHENEIAQSEAALGGEFSRFWVHNGFVQVNSEKMSKSLGNFKTIRDILESYLPETLRFFLLTRQYRSPIDFTFEAMNDAEKNLKRIYERLSGINNALARDKWNPAPKGGADAALAESLADELDKIATAWKDAMDDDLNSAAALGHINNLIHLAGRVIESKGLNKSEAGRDMLLKSKVLLGEWGGVLGLFGQEPGVFLSALKSIQARRNKVDVAKVEALMQERAEARAAKDFARSDAIRGELAGLGVEIRDTPKGAEWDLL